MHLGGLDSKLLVCILEHTACVQIALWRGVLQFYSRKALICMKVSRTVLVTIVEITQQPDVHLPIDLFRYCR